MSARQAGPPESTKRPRSALAGSYGHPVHPILVTIPIGAWTSSIVLDIVAMASDDPDGLPRASAWLLGIGLVGAVLAAIWGSIDLSTIPANTVARRTGLTHATLNSVALVLFLVSLLLRRSQGLDDVGTLPFLLSVLGLVVLGVSGWLGGRLAYRYGMRVADEATQAEGFRTQAAGRR
jgi:uncharacterized membrane protein